MASPRSRRVLKDLKIKDDNNVRTKSEPFLKQKPPFPPMNHMLQLFGTPTQKNRPTKKRWSKEEQPAEPKMIGTGQLVSLHCCTS